MPTCARAGGFVENMRSDFSDEPALFGDGNEGSGGDYSEFGVLPAHQSFNAYDAAIGQIDLGLVVDA